LYKLAILIKHLKKRDKHIHVHSYTYNFKHISAVSYKWPSSNSHNFFCKAAMNSFTFCIWAGFGDGLPRCAKVTDIFEATTHESSRR